LSEYKKECKDSEDTKTVGLVEKNEAMSRLAARMALSLTFCETWDESTIGHLPGSIWHHRSFSQERAIKATALALDWAGHHLTVEAHRVIRDAIIMKGLPRLENDFRTIEYIRHMNQGIVFNAARIIGLLALLPAYPRYRERLEEAERDLHEMIGNYVHDDGGTLEGCGYWNYTFSNALPQCYLLARYHGQTLAEYATEDVKKTGEYPVAMLSTAGDGTKCLPINDGHSQPVSPLLAAAFAQLSDNPEWQTYYAKCLTPERVQPAFEHLVLHPEGFEPSWIEDESLARPRFAVLPDTGQVDSVRADADGRLVHLHALSGPVEPGHYHEDKGSFILEVGDDAMLIDRGICNYGHPLTVSMKRPRLHNMLTPDNPGGLPVEQPNDVPGGRVTSAGARGGAVWTAADNTFAWEPGVFERSIRRIVSPDATLLLIDDDVALTGVRAMTFNLHTRKNVSVHGNEVTVTGDRCRALITPVNWEPSNVTSLLDGIDEHTDEVTAIRLTAAPSQTHRLVTAVAILPLAAGSGVSDEALWRLVVDGTRIVGTRGDARLSLDVSEPGEARFACTDAGTEISESL